MGHDNQNMGLNRTWTFTPIEEIRSQAFNASRMLPRAKRIVNIQGRKDILHVVPLTSSERLLSVAVLAFTTSICLVGTVDIR